jgi:MDMPI C-terminal domain
VHATDAGADWLVRLGEEAEASRGDSQADCSVRGRASDLHLLIWNRLTPERVDVQGDPSVLGLWKNVMQVHWSRSR